MTTETSLTILVVFLSAALAMFLTLSIFFVYKLIKVVDDVKHITEKAEQIADKAEAVTEMFGKAAAPLAFTQVLSNIIETVTRKRKG